MQYFEVRECRRYFDVRNLEVLKAIQPRMREGVIARKIRICSNARGRDRTRRFELARMREEEIVCEYSSLLECGRKRSRAKSRICLNVGLRDRAEDSNLL